MNTHDRNTILDNARTLLLRPDASASFQEGILQLIQATFEVTLTEAMELIHDAQYVPGRIYNLDLLSEDEVIEWAREQMFDDRGQLKIHRDEADKITVAVSDRLGLGAADTIERLKFYPPENEHIIIMAFHCQDDTMKSSQINLMEDLHHLPSDPSSNVVSMWVAMDERYHESDNDSAVFIKGSGVAALRRMRSLELADLVQLQGYTFENEEDGQTFIELLNKRHARDGYILVEDALDMLDLPQSFSFVGRRLAWTRPLTKASVRENVGTGGWYLDVPTPDDFR